MSISQARRAEVIDELERLRIKRRRMEIRQEEHDLPNTYGAVWDRIRELEKRLIQLEQDITGETPRDIWREE